MWRKNCRKELSLRKKGELKAQDNHIRTLLTSWTQAFNTRKRTKIEWIFFLTLFEAAATRCCVEKKNWALLLSYKLTSKLTNFMLQDDLFKNEKSFCLDASVL